MKTYLNASKIAKIKNDLMEKFTEYQQMIGDLNITKRCDYKVIRYIGAGGYGVVKLAQNNRNGEHVVLKFSKHINGTYVRKSTVRELCLLSQFDHPHIIKLLDICLELRKINDRILPRFTLALELCRCDLRSLIFGQIRYQPIHSQSIFQQILLGLEHLHRYLNGSIRRQYLFHFIQFFSRNIIHRDLKPANVLIGLNGFVKLGDFGLAREMNQENLHTPHVGTKRYMPPEILLKVRTYNESFDMFAAGVILTELFGRKCLFRGDSLTSITRSMVRLLGKVDNSSLPGSEQCQSYRFLFSRHPPGEPQLSNALHERGLADEAANLVEKLLSINPEDRPSASEALAHPYFTNFTLPPEDLLTVLPEELGTYD
ncbi:unnamed protein product [Rodentolepis nana]|uniref:Protein kinase domain-containing protein n=1 Tax=Rodentolepis nana TaxID=102285 RepID=A0A0R3T396_RODNA|nr:unnamed protein product [Rodentolepis nana]